MEPTVLFPLAAWESFYVIIGSSGAALIGLQFVVIALIADTDMRRTSGSIRAFGTPTVAHFGSALFLSATMSIPWPSFIAIAIAVAACGITGVVYSAAVVYHARRQKDYRPVWQDWLWYIALPCSIYAALVLAALCLHTRTQIALFVIAGAALGLLLIAIHNTWDTVTYIVIAGPRAVQTNADVE